MFKKLFSPGKIGRLELKNRIVFPPMGTIYAAEDGLVTDQMINYYVKRAEGGAGLIVVEAAYTRRYVPYRLWINDDRAIPGLRRLVNAIHKAGARAVLQVHSRRGREDVVDPVSASGVPLQKHFRSAGEAVPRVLTTADVEAIVAEHAACVHRVREAGFDGLMLHGGSGYLICEFLSPLTNKRTDKYGGNVVKRAKLALEFLEVSRQKLGDDFPIIFRLSIDDRLNSEEGFQLKDGITVAKLLERAGVDAIDVVSGVLESYEWTVPPMCVPRGYNVALAAEVRKAVKVPVMVAGRINDPYLAEGILDEGKADFIDLGRALLADPDFPQKVKAGLVEDIRKCLACDECINIAMRARMNELPFLICAVNPAVGREKEFEIKPAEKRKEVLVIGGGPAGMEAARIAALRGHKVTLWEKAGRLGGQLNLAIIPPYKEEVKNLIDYLSTQICKLGVRVELEKEATPGLVTEFNSDVVVVATGSRPLIPKLVDIERDNVVNAHDVLGGVADVGENVIVIGGGLVGCETAEFLVDKGKKLTIVEMLEQVAGEVAPHERWFLLPRLEQKGVRILVRAKAEAITKKGLVITDGEGKAKLLEADTIVFAIGAAPDTALYEGLKGKVSQIYLIGDCTGGGRIVNAIHGGASVALKL